MAKKKQVKNKKPSEKWKKFKVEGKKVSRGKTCPKCGPGTLLATHKDRQTCGSCDYTIFSQKQI